MSTFGDYKAYKQYQPYYNAWKYNRDLFDAQKEAYLKLHPEKINHEDIQRGKALLRAIDTMDEYSQKRAEDMEVATETAVTSALELAVFVGSALGLFASTLKPVKNFMNKLTKGSKNSKLLGMVIPAAAGALIATIAAFPLFSWAAKKEVGASRKGRFEAMRKDLSSYKSFAILTPEQYQQAMEIASKIKSPKEQNKQKNLQGIKILFVPDKNYHKQRSLFEYELNQDLLHINDKMSEEDILNAKKDQQLLTKLVEEIDIASQDYAENAELAGGALVTGILACGALLDLGLQKLLNAFKVKSAVKISVILKTATIALSIAGSIFTAQLSKQASRVGRYKVKQELMNDPAKFVYVDEKELANIKDVKIKENKKQNIFEFLKTAWKNNKEYENYKKIEGKNEKCYYKALEQVELSEKQVRDAKRLQKNTFRTFNKVDENSQKYSESVEALGQSVAYPIVFITSGIGAALAIPFLTKKAKNGLEMAENFAKYMGTILLSSIPSIFISSLITKEQKKASRIANMISINEMQDYRQFKG